MDELQFLRLMNSIAEGAVMAKSENIPERRDSVDEIIEEAKKAQELLEEE